jgi:hypothetical protein
MRLLIILFLFKITIIPVIGQEGFYFNTSKKKITVPFKLINNLIFIPVKVNGEELTFLLDTGVEETILFSLENKEVGFFNVEKIKLKGLGSSGPVEAMKSSKNRLEIKDYTDDQHDIYIVLNQEFNFSSYVGIPVNGILGYHFFKNHIIEINYKKKKLYLYMRIARIEKRIKKKYIEKSISIEKSKPYVYTEIQSGNKKLNAKLLLDLGNSNALWIFRNKITDFPFPDKTIFDYLGRGFSGEVFGERGRISKLSFGNKSFEKPIGTFPDSTSIKDLTLVENRVGSIGGEIFRRFDIVFDYPENKVYTRPNSYVNDPFHYNMSGIDVQHEGLEWVKNIYTEKPKLSETAYGVRDESSQNKLSYKFELKPIFRISNIRKGSNAEAAGILKGDKILKINSSGAHRLTIEKINRLLRSVNGKEIKMEIEREGKLLKFKFRLKTLI